MTPTGNPVQEIRVDFPVISDWDALEKAYDNLQADLTRKYGIDPVVNRNLAVYNLPNGTISLDADVSNQSSWHVILKYANAATTASTGCTRLIFSELQTDQFPTSLFNEGLGTDLFIIP